MSEIERLIESLEKREAHTRLRYFPDIPPIVTALRSLQAENARLTREVARLREALNWHKPSTDGKPEFYCRHMDAFVYSCTACDSERAALAKP